MKTLGKYFDELATKFDEAAFEANLDDFTVEFDAINRPAEISFFEKGGKYYVEDISIFGEDGENVAGKYPLFCNEVRKYVPSYEYVKRSLEESDMTPEELYFGSYQGYLNYRYG